MTLPGPLGRLELGEILGHLRTGGQVPVPEGDGEPQVASLWFVVCRDRCWLVAATLEGSWTTASTDVALERGWTWDALRVGAWSAPLRPGTRAAADDLLRRWRLAEKGGDEVPAPAAMLAPERAPAARGADLPDWIPAEVPCEPGARWLLATDTGARRPVASADGQVRQSPIWEALSDQGAQRVVRGPPVQVGPSTGPWTAVQGPSAWELAVRHALDAHAWDRALALISEAFVLERHGELWSWIGLLALASDAPDAAVGALLRQLQNRPDLDLLEGANAWAKRIKRLERAGPRLPDGPLAECALPPLPPGLPWPPEGPTQAHAMAGLLAGRDDDALALYATASSPVQHAVATAAVKVWRGHPDAGQAWWDVANRLWPSDPDAAREAARRALPLHPSPALVHWGLSAWAVASNADPVAHWDAALPSVPPSELQLTPRAWRKLAEHAERLLAWDAASAAWRAVADGTPAEREALRNQARIAEIHLGQPEVAIDALELLAARTERALEPDPPRWWVLTELARLLARAGRTEDAIRALARAVSGDFLHADALTRAIEVGQGLVSAERLAWWTHLRAVLVGGVPTPGRTPLATLNARELEALHPGGTGWLTRARQTLDARDPPNVRDLVRGLERVEASRHPALADAVRELSTALGLAVPPTYLFRGDGAHGLAAWPTDPPVVLVGADHLEAGPHFLEPAALRFALAVELVHLAARHPLLAFDGALVGTSRSAYATFGRYAGAAETVVDVFSLVPGVDQLAKIQTVIKVSKRVFSARSMVEKASGVAQTGFSWLGGSADAPEAVGRTLQGDGIQLRVHADRAALRLTGDLQMAVQAVLRGAPGTTSSADRARADGLIAVLPELDADTRLRLASLVGFAASADDNEPADAG